MQPFVVAALLANQTSDCVAKHRITSSGLILIVKSSYMVGHLTPIPD